MTNPTALLREWLLALPDVAALTSNVSASWDATRDGEVGIQLWQLGGSPMRTNEGTDLRGSRWRFELICRGGSRGDKVPNFGTALALSDAVIQGSADVRSTQPVYPATGARLVDFVIETMTRDVDPADGDAVVLMTVVIVVVEAPGI